MTTNSFEMVAHEWHAHRSERWTTAYASATMVKVNNDVFSSIGSTPVDQITPPMVLQIVRSIESRGAGETARKCLEMMN